MINKTDMIFSKKVFTFADFSYEKEISLLKLRISSEMLLLSLTGKKRQKVHILKKENILLRRQIITLY